MIAVDTSVWIDWVAGRPTPQAEYFAEGLDSGSADFALVDVTITEILQGLRTNADARRVERHLEPFEVLRLENIADFRAAAGLYRAARRTGITVRSTIDCLIAAVCIRDDVQLLHSDVDFDRLASVSTLTVVAA